MYAYYCPEDGSYFRWVRATKALPGGEFIRDFEFQFSDSMTGDVSFKIPYSKGRVSVFSYMRDYNNGGYNYELQYMFNMKLMESKIGFDSTIFSRDLTTNDGGVSVVFDCTKNGTFYFKFDHIDTHPAGYQFAGNGSVYGY